MSSPASRYWPPCFRPQARSSGSGMSAGRRPPGRKFRRGESARPPAAGREPLGADAPQAGHPADELGEARVGTEAAGQRRGRVAVEREDEDGGGGRQGGARGGNRAGAPGGGGP